MHANSHLPLPQFDGGSANRKNTGKRQKRNKKDGTSQIPFSVTQQFGRITFRIHTAFNTEVANCTREYLSLIAETVDSIWATVFQAHRIPAMPTNEFFVRTGEARL
jgi:hypothetical protein